MRFKSGERRKHIGEWLRKGVRKKAPDGGDNIWTTRVEYGVWTSRFKKEVWLYIWGKN